MNKFRNVRTTVDGIQFASKAEAIRYHQLKMMEKAKVIWALKLQPRYVLAPSCILDGRKKPALTYVADFEYMEDGKDAPTVEDIKSKATITSTFRIKQHLMKTVLGIEVRIVCTDAARAA